MIEMLDPYLVLTLFKVYFKEIWRLSIGQVMLYMESYLGCDGMQHALVSISWKRENPIHCLAVGFIQDL
jgi:hypothetical protein